MAKKKEESILKEDEKLKRDIAAYNLKIIQLNNEMQQLAGAKAYAENLLKTLQEKKDGGSI